MSVTAHTFSLIFSLSPSFSLYCSQFSFLRWHVNLLHTFWSRCRQVRLRASRCVTRNSSVKIWMNPSIPHGRTRYLLLLRCFIEILLILSLKVPFGRLPIFVTGVTGFLGIHLLDRILRGTSEDIIVYVLIRSKGVGSFDENFWNLDHILRFFGRVWTSGTSQKRMWIAHLDGSGHCPPRRCHACYTFVHLYFFPKN